MTENSNRVSRPPSKLSECITGVELNQVCNESLEMENENFIYEKAVKHLQCDGKINNVTFKTLRIQLWKSVLVNYFGKSKTNVQTQKTGVVIKVIFDTEKEKKTILLKLTCMNRGQWSFKEQNAQYFRMHSSISSNKNVTIKTVY
jgi:hypothetical protein